MIKLSEFHKKLDDFLKPIIKNKRLSVFSSSIVMFNGIITNGLELTVSNTERMINVLLVGDKIKGHGLYFHEEKEREDYDFNGPEELYNKTKKLFNYIIDLSEGLIEKLPEDYAKSL